MPNLYTFDEYVDMLLVFGECRKNSREAQRIYQGRYPDRPTPAHTTFAYVESRLRRGNFPSGKHVQHMKVVRTEENVINVLAYAAINPHVSIRRIAMEIDISKSSVQRILKEHHYHPFKVHLVQGLCPADFERRLSFIAQMEIRLMDEPSFLNKILWTDESRFHNNGIVNRHNSHYWSVQNPKWIRETNFQRIWGVNVWCGLLNGYLIGPFYYEGTLTGQRYLDFLRNDLPVLIENIPLDERETMWIQQGGAPPHNFNEVQNYLLDTFSNRWIGTHGPIAWPPRSPDLSPLDFFLWGYLKEVVYVNPVNTLEELKNRITGACRTITPEMIAATCTRNVLERFQACITVAGSQFEHLLNKR